MRLIDADALEYQLRKMKSFGDLSAKGAIRAVRDAPTVDAVPVVRCGECKYNIDNPREYADNDIVACFGWCEPFRTHYGEDAYCPFGERR